MTTERSQYAEKYQDDAGIAETPELDVRPELLDQLVKGPMTQGDLERIFPSLKKAVIAEVSPEFISQVTEEVMAEVIAWQSRPLEALYPVVFFDALRINIRDESVVRNKAVYLALGVLPDGSRDVLDIWIEQSEGAKFWLNVFNDLKTRGCNDILIPVVDGLKGLAEPIETA